MAPAPRIDGTPRVEGRGARIGASLVDCDRRDLHPFALRASEGQGRPSRRPDQGGEQSGRPGAADNPPEWVNREGEWRADVIGTFPNGAPIFRLVGALLLETNHEWAVARRYMTHEPLSRVTDNPTVRQSPPGRASSAWLSSSTPARSEGCTGRGLWSSFRSGSENPLNRQPACRPCECSAEQAGMRFGRVYDVFAAR
jgi:hypothetical protein